MKWNLFRNTIKAPSRAPRNGRRVTGVSKEIPPGVKLLLNMALFFGICLALCWGGWKSFEHYYFRSRHLFVLKDVRKNVMITTGKTLTPDLICEVLGLREGINLFSLPIDLKRRELLEQAPNIRDLSIIRRMPDKMMINIIEREPLARIGANGRVVDEEGVVFVRYAGTGGLPLIKGSDELAQVKPGDRLHGLAMAAVDLVRNASRPECRLRLLVLDAGKEDYLLLTLSDHRQAKIAWEGMEDREKNTEVKMQKQFDDLSVFMDSDVGRMCLMWDARVPGRIAAVLPGME